MEGERRWERVLSATCLEEEATNLRSKPMEAVGSSAIARAEKKRSPCFVTLHANG